MVNEGLGLGLGQPAPVTPGNEGDAQGMEACIHSCRFDDFIDPPVFVLAKRAGDGAFLLRKSDEQWAQAWVYWDCETLARVIIGTLRIPKAYRTGLYVDLIYWDSALGKPATGIKGDFKSYPHPFRLSAKCGSNLLDISVREFGFCLLCDPDNTEPKQGVGLGKFSTDCFRHELSKEPEFQEGGVMAYGPTEYPCSSAPGDIGGTVLVSYGVRVSYTGCLEKLFDGSPSRSVSALTSMIECARRFLKVCLDIFRHPRNNSRGPAGSANLLLLCAYLLGFALSFTGIGRVIMSEACRMFLPFPRIEVPLPQEPKPGTGMLPKMGHAGGYHMLSQTRSVLSWFTCELPRESGCMLASQKLPLHYEAL